MLESPSTVTNEPSVRKSGVVAPFELDSNHTSANGTSSLSEQCAHIHSKVQTFLSRPARDERTAAVQKQTRLSLDVIAEALEQYSLSELSFSYNGGKDCLVLLVLYLCALHTATLRPTNPLVLPPRLESVYIVPPNPFPSVTAFVLRTSAQYQLSLSRSSLPMRDAFAAYLSEHPGVKAIFVGTRRTDPHGGALTYFDATDGGWPKFVRIHPVIDWKYADIWSFVKELGIDYCELYDQGYTSLGGTTDTLPNPALKDGKGGFRPAYELVLDGEERLGREK